MNITKKELALRVARIMRKTGYRKKVKIPRHSFTISDSCGNQSSFDVTGRVKKVTIDESDVHAVIDACVELIYETIANGDAIKINGLGTLGVKTRAAGKVCRMDTGEIEDVPERRIPYFSASDRLRAIARTSGNGTDLSMPSYDIYEDECEPEQDGE